MKRPPKRAACLNHLKILPPQLLLDWLPEFEDFPAVDDFALWPVEDLEPDCLLELALLFLDVELLLALLPVFELLFCCLAELPLLLAWLDLLPLVLDFCVLPVDLPPVDLLVLRLF